MLPRSQGLRQPDEPAGNRSPVPQAVVPGSVGERTTMVPRPGINLDTFDETRRSFHTRVAKKRMGMERFTCPPPTADYAEETRRTAMTHENEQPVGPIPRE